MKKLNQKNDLRARAKGRRLMAVWTALVLAVCVFTVHLLFSYTIP